jgi:hypothetical protein
MRIRRLLLACSIAACVAVTPASPAWAEEPACPDSWIEDYLNGLNPAWSPSETVEIAEGTITIRGDLLTAETAALVEHYVSSTLTFAGCLQEWATSIVAPYANCVLEQSAAIRANPLLYVEVGSDLVVKIHYGQAQDDAIRIFNCNGIVTSGE